MATAAALGRVAVRPEQRHSVAISVRKWALSKWDRVNAGVTYDPELFRREILPRLAGVKLSEIVEAIGCSKAWLPRSGGESGRPRVDVTGALAGSASTGDEFTAPRCLRAKVLSNTFCEGRGTSCREAQQFA